jgi:aerobic carbon-monoxide dehydrogenase medium subunit
MKGYDYHRPGTLEEAWSVYEKNEGAGFIAGGTDVMVGLRRNNSNSPKAVISLRTINELSGVVVKEKIQIGAATTIDEMIETTSLQTGLPVLVAAARRLGCAQIRNAATLGGNLCNASPCADTAPPLLVLEATVKLRRGKTVREVPLSDFFVGPKQSCLESGEIMTEVMIPQMASGAKATFLKKGRVKMDLATASLALLLEMDGEKCIKARVAVGSVAPVPLRLVEVEKFLQGVELTKEIVAEAAELAMKTVTPIDDVRSTAEYRKEIIGVYLQRAAAELLGWSEQ